MSKKDKAYSVRIPPKLWEDHKPQIVALYKDHSLGEVLERITTTDFAPSEYQLRDKIAKWPSCKKNLTSRKRKKINREIEETKLGVENCEVVVHGEVQPADRTVREFKRTRNRDYRGLSPGLPGHILVRTSPANERGLRRGLDFSRFAAKQTLHLTGKLIHACMDFIELPLQRISREAAWTARHLFGSFNQSFPASISGQPPVNENLPWGCKFPGRRIQFPYHLAAGSSEDMPQTTTTRQSPQVEEIDADEDEVLPASPILEWSAEDREAAGITAEETRQFGWRDLYDWKD